MLLTLSFESMIPTSLGRRAGRHIVFFSDTGAMSVLGGLAIKPLVQAIRIAIRKKLDPWQRTGFGVSTVLEVPYPWRRTVTDGRSAWTRWAGLVYLFLKLYLYLRGHIFLDVPANGLLLLLLIAPVPRARWEPWRAAVVAIVALGLARYEILPAPMGAAVSFLAGQPRPSIAFVWQFLRDYFGVVEAVGLFLAVPLCLLAWRRPVPAGAGALVLLLAAAANQNVTGGSRMRQSIDRFYAEEATRGVEFQASSSAFDILMIQVCSLSWDDLDYLGIDAGPFFQNFDYLFTSFNSVTSYSVDAGLRLMRSPRGQVRYHQLFQTPPPGGLLTDSLRALGYQTYLVYDYQPGWQAQQFQDWGRSGPPLPLGGLPTGFLSYDDSPVTDLMPLLERAWSKRMEDGSKQALVWVNTAALHAGVHRREDLDWWRRQNDNQVRRQQQKENVTAFLETTERFLHILEKSGRRVLVVFVAEHGRGIRGSRLQPPELRETPTPELVLVPLAFRLVDGPRNLDGSPHRPQVVTESVSYLAVAHVIKRILDSPSFTPTKQILEGLPRTEFVAETYNGHLVVQFEGHYWVLACSETPFGRRCLTRAIDYRPSSLSPPWTK